MITEFSRTEMLIGPKALNALKGSCVVVFGAGGVGSHAIEALARSGIGHLIPYRQRYGFPDKYKPPKHCLSQHCGPV